MVLEADEALGGFAELGEFRELARRDLGVPVAEPFTYSTYLVPFMVWTHFSGVMTMWIVFHSPTGLVASTVGA